MLRTSPIGMRGGITIYIRQVVDGFVLVIRRVRRAKPGVESSRRELGIKVE
jgi:hypothetical protein